MGQITSLQRQTLVLRTLFVLLIAYVLLFTISYTLEYQIELNSTRWLTASRIALFITACGYLWISRSEYRLLIDPFALCLIAILVTGAVSGLINEHERFAYARHAFQYAFLLTFYLVGRELGSRPIRWMPIKLISNTILLGYMIATILYALTPGLHSGSYSFQPNLALLSVASSLSCANWFGVLAGSFIIVVGNKRAVYLGLAIMLALYLVLRLNQGRQMSLLRRLVFVGGTATTIGISLGFAVNVFTSSISSYLNVSMPTVVERFTLDPTFNAGAEATAAQEAKVDPLVRLTSARSIELQAAWEMAKHSPTAALIGKGFGGEFKVKYISPNDYELVQFDRSQADLASVQVALTSGLPLAFIFTVMLSGMIAMVFLRCDSIRGAEFAIALFSIGSLLDALLGFHATNPISWMALGIVSRFLLPKFSLASLAQPLKRLSHHA